MPKSLDLAKNWLKYHLFLDTLANYQEKASFLLILTKSFEPIFKIAGQILRHMALEGTLIMFYGRMAALFK